MSWMPIETAPDGVLCLFCNMSPAIEARHWAFVDWVVDGQFMGNRFHQATHWQPLPEPPAS